MTHIYRLEDAQIVKPSFVTIGVFDGVHIGHQHLLRQLAEQAHADDCVAVVLTFHPHPDVFFRKIQERYYLTTPEQRSELLHEMGIDYVITHPFNDEVRHIRAATFVDSLVENLSLRSLWVGADFAMGYQREGNVEFLRKQGGEKNFDVQVVSLVTHDDNGHVINSSAIRKFLSAGDVDSVRNWLGRGYSVTGEVIRGERRGHSIGFPTANIAVWDQQIIPANGVYAGWAMVNDKQYMAMTNVGTRPTFAGDDITVEAYLLDFDHEIYGETISLSFETRLRDEKKFDGIKALIAQIQADVAAGQAFLAQRI